MAGGWARDGAVQDQIDDTVSDAVKAARARIPHGREFRTEKAQNIATNAVKKFPKNAVQHYPVFAPALSASQIVTAR